MDTLSSASVQVPLSTLCSLSTNGCDADDIVCAVVAAAPGAIDVDELTLSLETTFLGSSGVVKNNTVPLEKKRK